MKHLIQICIAIVACLFAPHITMAQSLVITNEGKSEYVIIIPEKAPQSVEVAAQELADCIEIATGAQLSVQSDSSSPQEHIISIGATLSLKEAGISLAEIADDGYLIQTKGNNVYIAGNDTPDGEHYTLKGGKSNGSANGVYTFLEDYLNVRWLMPGELGRDVPHKSTFTVDHINRIEAPKFIWRLLPFLSDSFYSLGVSPTKGVQKWQQFQKLGSSINLVYGHTWDRTVPRELYQKHPEWFPLIGGKRSTPPKTYKLETTNPALVDFFSQQIINEIQQSDSRWRTYSLSPSDNYGWSESAQSRALYDNKMFNGNPSMTSLVLDFYTKVTNQVHEKSPNVLLAGYIYSDYLNPPEKRPVQFPRNFIPIVAPSPFTYGYKLYRSDNRKRWESVIDTWSKAGQDTWFYFDLPNIFGINSMPGAQDRFAGTTGIVTPAAPGILNFIFHNLSKYNFAGARLYGTPSWSNSAMANYMDAKLLWDPTLDAYEIQREWLQRAYGDNAGAVMEEFYAVLDDYFQKYSEKAAIGWALTPEVFKGIYGGSHYNRLEEILLKAKNQPMTASQKLRFQLIENNLIVLQWRLRNAGYISDEFNSPLTRSDQQIMELLDGRNQAFEHFPEAILGRSSQRIKTPRPKVKVSKQVDVNKSTFAMRDGDITVLLHASQDQQVTILPNQVDHDMLFASYVILNASNKIVTKGVLCPELPISFEATEGKTYYLYFPMRPRTKFAVTIKNATLARGNVTNDTVTLQAQDTLLYVYYPYENARLEARASSSGDAVVITKR